MPKNIRIRIRIRNSGNIFEIHFASKYGIGSFIPVPTLESNSDFDPVPSLDPVVPILGLFRIFSTEADLKKSCGRSWNVRAHDGGD